jgi:hypothetical protein
MVFLLRRPPRLFLAPPVPPAAATLVQERAAPGRGFLGEPKSPKSRVQGRRSPQVVVQGAKAPVDGCPEGEPKSPSGRSRCRNTGRGPGRGKSWPWDARGADSPLPCPPKPVAEAGRWVQGEPQSPGAMQRRTLPSRSGLDARTRLDNPLARTSARRSSLGIPGGSAGDGKSPRKVSAVLPAHTLYIFSLADCAPS